MWRRLLVIAGLVALVAYVMRRRRPPPAPSEPAVDPAEELRRKLDETRTRAEPETETQLSDDLDERRRQVHERARAARDEMRGPSPD